ncbi:secreted protein containing Cytochrome c, class I domain protein, partial [Candidatus Magnetobacterium bavaricum]
MAKAAKAFVVVLLILIPSLSFGDGEGDRYNMYCSACHGTDRLGVTASPLLPQLLTRYSDERLSTIIRKGLPATQMPSWPDMNDDDVKAIISYIRKPVSVKWTTQDIEKSIAMQEANPVRIESFKRIHNIKDITAVVERGNDSVWIMTGDRMVDSF